MVYQDGPRLKHGLPWSSFGLPKKSNKPIETTGKLKAIKGKAIKIHFNSKIHDIVQDNFMVDILIFP